METKPYVFLCMMFSIFHEINNKPHRDDIITNLTDFTVEKLEIRSRIEFKNSVAMLVNAPDTVDKLFFIATDDPLIEWAGDWRDMGCFGLIYKCEGNVKIVSRLPLIIECDNAEKTLTVPGR